jgi:hypothetical protein
MVRRPRLGGFALAFAAVALAAMPAATAASEPPGLTLALEVSSTASTQAPTLGLALRITNTGSHDCQVSPNPAAAVITRVVDGQDPVRPSLDVVEVEGGLASVASDRQPLAAGASVRIPIRVDALGVESVSPMPDDSTAIAQTWALQPDRDARITVALQAAAVAGCAVPAATTTTVHVGGSGAIPIPALVGAGLAIVAVIAIVGFVLRRRRTARALVVVLALVASPSIGPRPADAVISNHLTGDYEAAAGGCFDLYRAPSGDPAGVFAAANASSHVIRIENDVVGLLQFVGLGAKGARTPGVGANSTIYWSPNDLEQEGGVAGDACATLYHLLAHAVDVANGNVDTALCPGGLTIEEVRAVNAENAYRRTYNLPVLTTDRGKALPASLSDCKPKPTRKKKYVLTCGNRPCGSLAGDPHYRTYDALAYDLQAVGEFVLTRSVDGAFEVQVRQQPALGWRAASVATAIAARIGSSRVIVSVGIDSLQSGSGLGITVDGSPITGVGEHAVGGGSVELAPDGDQVVLRWADGSVALASVIPAVGLDLEVKPADSLRGHLVGLLGDDNGNDSDDFRLGDGAPVASPPSFDDLYRRFADAWRVTDATSLFDYAAGTSTETFTDRSAPGSADDTDVAAELPAAQDVCSELGADPADQAHLAECAYDLAATGNASFAAAAIDRSLPPADDAIELGAEDIGGSGGPSPAPSSSGATVDRGSLTPGVTVTGSIGDPAEREVYDLQADAGAVGFFTAGGDCSPLSGGGSPTWYLAGASDPSTPITGTLPFCVDLGRFAFPAAGAYVLVLDANGYTVPYSFTWSAVAASSDAPIALGTDVDGSIATDGQRNTSVFTTTDAGADIRFVSPASCDDGFVWKVTQNDSTTGEGALCGTSQPVHLGGSGTWQIVISNPLGTGEYSFRIEAATP